ncbi:MAG: ATP-binding protein [Anaerolineae bacterium]|nr:ATP-binding protein [Anaerolineae bacterium]MDW8099789.1 ATP-binding protein [Anaerolineae bacterium]
MGEKAHEQKNPIAVEWDAWLNDTQKKAVWLGMAGMYGMGLVLVGSPAQFRNPSTYLWLALLVFALAGLALLASRWAYLLAGWVLILGGLAAILLAVTWGGQASALVLLTVVIALASLAISLIAGLALAAGCTLLLLLAPGSLAQLPLAWRVSVILGAWGVCALIWLLLDSLLTTVRWAWSSYEESRRALEQARDQRVKLCEAIEDLSEANLQLMRLNRLAQGLRQAAEEERRAKEQFVANVSHELRTPLNMIIGFCEMIINSPQTYGDRIPSTLLADLEVVLRNSRHLSDLIDDVLDLSQIETGRMALTKERVSIGELINAAAIAVRPLLISKGLYLETEVAEDLPAVFCDRTRIREVILNLLSNAGRFTEKGGVRVRAWQEGDDVMVSVSDTGPGIAERDLTRLFRPFEQLDGSIRRRYGGTGLGLSISKGFVELHGGKMWAESEVGRGTTFYFRLPIDPPVPLEAKATRWLNPYQPYEERPHPSRAKLPPLRPRLIVLERGNGLQRLLSRYLDKVEIIAVRDFEEAVLELNRTPAQALLINAMTLADALGQAAKLGALPYDIPVLFCAVPGMEQAADALGASEYLVKPVTREALLTALKHVNGKAKKVLVVDDEPDALQLFSRMLAEAGQGYRVLRAESAQQALQILRHERPDVVLLDLVMPEMDGFEFLAAKEKDPILKGIPVILISARDPLGQPIVSSGLAVTCRSGLSVQQLLSSIEVLIGTLARMPLTADRARPATVPG